MIRQQIRSVAINSMILGVFLLIACPFVFLIPTDSDIRLVLVKLIFGIGGPALALWLLYRNMEATCAIRLDTSGPAMVAPRERRPK